MTLTDILYQPAQSVDSIAVDMILYEFEQLQGKAALYQLAPDPDVGDYFETLIRALQPKMDAYAISKGDNPEARLVCERNAVLLSSFSFNGLQHG